MFHLLDVETVGFNPWEFAVPRWSHADVALLEASKCLKGEDQKDTVTRCQWMKVLQRIWVCPERCGFSPISVLNGGKGARLDLFFL